MLQRCSIYPKLQIRIAVHGHDNISSSTLKCIAHEICQCLTLIINQSITTGIFPENLKITKVVPIYIRKMISLKLKTIGLYQFYL